MSDDLYAPTDRDALQMENELLAFEVRYLKSRAAQVERLEELERDNRRLRRRLEQSRGETEEAREALSQLGQRLKKAERAEHELKLLLASMSKGPVGRVFRLRSSFRNLERRYLGTGE